jgi:outer membrane protein W
VPRHPGVSRFEPHLCGDMQFRFWASVATLFFLSLTARAQQGTEITLTTGGVVPAGPMSATTSPGYAALGAVNWFVSERFRLGLEVGYYQFFSRTQAIDQTQRLQDLTGLPLSQIYISLQAQVTPIIAVGTPIGSIQANVTQSARIVPLTVTMAYDFAPPMAKFRPFLSLDAGMFFLLSSTTISSYDFNGSQANADRLAGWVSANTFASRIPARQQETNQNAVGLVPGVGVRYALTPEIDFVARARYVWVLDGYSQARRETLDTYNIWASYIPITVGVTFRLGLDIQ